MKEPYFKFITETQEQAGLTGSEMITLLPITRGTFYSWKRGGTVGDKLRYQLTIARCKVIAKAVEAGRLPLPADTPQGERLRMINGILQDVKAGR